MTQKDPGKNRNRAEAEEHRGRQISRLQHQTDLLSGERGCRAGIKWIEDQSRSQIHRRKQAIDRGT